MRKYERARRSFIYTFVYIGIAHNCRSYAKEFNFTGDRETVRKKACEEALNMILEELSQV